MPERLDLRARKTPSSPHPPNPPQVPVNIESLYYAVDDAALAHASSGKTIVTSQILYHPGLLAFARVVFEGTRWNVYHEREVVRVIPFPPQGQVPDWEKNQIGRWDNAFTRSDAQGVAFYAIDDTYEFSQARFEELQEDFILYLISTEKLELEYNPHLKIHRRLDEDVEAFRVRCVELLHESHAQEYQTLLDTLERQESRLKERLEREIREHGDPEDASTNGILDTNSQEMESHGARVDMDDIRRELAEIQKSREIKLSEFEENLDMLSRQMETDILRLNHGFIKVLRMALVWLPYTEFVIQEEDTRRLELVRSFQ